MTTPVIYNNIYNYMEIKPNELYKKRYTLRRPFPNAKGFEVSIPYFVVEREASKHNLSVDEFLKLFECECLFNGIDGILYRFCRKADDKTTTSKVR